VYSILDATQKLSAQLGREMGLKIHKIMAAGKSDPLKNGAIMM
jgi:hypothetical protein